MTQISLFSIACSYIHHLETTDAKMGQHVSNVVGNDLETHGNSLRPVSASPAFKLWINIITGKDMQFGQSTIGQSDPVLSRSICEFAPEIHGSALYNWVHWVLHNS